MKKYFNISLSSSQEKRLFYLVKIVFLIAIFSLLLIQISRINFETKRFSHVFLSAYSKFYLLIIGVLLIIPNYLFESIRWKFLTENIQPRNLPEAFKDILLGLMGGLFTPFMIGDYIGRSLRFPIRKRKAIVMVNVFGSLCQTYSALFFGTLSLLFWKYSDLGHFPKAMNYLGASLLFSCVFGIFVLFANERLKITFSKLSAFLYLNKYIIHYENISIRTRIWVLFLTLCRSVVYILQFLAIYYAFGMELSILHLFIGVNLSLLAKTVGGGLNIFGDLSLRHLVGLYFFTPFAVSAEVIIISTLFIWLINIFFPVLMGTLFIKNIKT